MLLCYVQWANFFFTVQWLSSRQPKVLKLMSKPVLYSFAVSLIEEKKETCKYCMSYINKDAVAIERETYFCFVFFFSRSLNWILLTADNSHCPNAFLIMVCLSLDMSRHWIGEDNDVVTLWILCRLKHFSWLLTDMEPKPCHKVSFKVNYSLKTVT